MDNPIGDSPSHEQPTVALFVTCLADLFRPAVAFASLRLLERAGCRVEVPLSQTCCGQPAYNSGDYASAAPVARQLVQQLESFEYVVVPSGSCAAMICHHYPGLLQGEWRQRAKRLAEKTWELTSFLRDVMPLPAARGGTADLPAVAYHDACAGLRELGVREQPRQLLREQCGIEVKELSQRDVCCGFGGTFCAKMPVISARMADQKIDDAMATGAGVLTSGDLGCLLSIAGRAGRRGSAIELRHVAELLDGALSEPPIGRRR